MSQRPIEIDDLFTFTLVGDVQISPDGLKVAYVRTMLDRDKNDYLGNIHLWEGGECRQYTVGGKDSSPRWSPDGKWLAFLSGREGKAQIYLMSSRGGEPVRLTDAPLGVGTPAWSPDSAHIAYSGPVSLVPEPKEDDPPRTRVIERAVYKFDGTGFIEDRRHHIFVCTIASKDVRQITDGDWNDTEPAWSPDAGHIAFTSNRHPEWDLQPGSDIWIVPADGGEARRVTDGRGAWSGPVFSPDGSRIAFTGFARPEGERPTYYHQLWTISRSGGEPENLLVDTDLAVGNSVASDWSIAGDDALVWTERGIHFLVSERGNCSVYRWQGGLQRLTEGKRHVMDFSVAGDTLVYTAADATHPAEVFRCEIASSSGLQPVSAGIAKPSTHETSPIDATQRMDVLRVEEPIRAEALGYPGRHADGDEGEREERLTFENDEAVARLRVVQPEKFTFIGAEGVEIDGWLMKPACYVEGQRYPVIVYIHGGPISAYGETFFHEFQALAGAGFGVFYCNPHGGSSYGQAFQVSIMGDWGNFDYQDMMAGTDRLVELPWVDANRLGVAGGSYGGFLVNWIISHSDRFAAASAQRSICNHVSQGGISDWAATRGERLGGTPEGNPERLWEMSPLKYVSKVKTPTLILHSERDDRCPIAQGEEWFAALRRLRVPVRFIRFPEESHGLSRSGKPSRRVERMNHIKEWFKVYL